MKKIILFVLLIVFCGAAQAQYKNFYGFGKQIDRDTVSVSGGAITTIPISFIENSGAIMLWGYVKKLSGPGGPLNIGIDVAMLHGPDKKQGPWHNLDSLAVAADSSFYEYSVARESFWGIAQGIIVRYALPDSSTSSYLVNSNVETKK